MPRGNRGGYRGGGYQGGGYQGGGSNEYSSMGNEYQSFASNSYYGHANQSYPVARDVGFSESGNNGFHSFRGSQGITIPFVATVNLSTQLTCL